MTTDRGAGNPQRWRHEHSFGQDRLREGERRTLVVIAITAVMMVVEVGAGLGLAHVSIEVHRDTGAAL
ncbi:MAG: hypothetical protein MUC71_01620 [Steroidobacteraceae bacterium]|nr:hypothetical protein [Steroidobacteraceae bacterium]